MINHRIRTAALLIMTLVVLVMTIFPVTAEDRTVSGNKEETASGFGAYSEIREDQTGKWEYGLLDDGTAVITGFHADSDTLSIPDEVDGYPVTVVARIPQGKIDYSAIRRIKKLTLPKGLKAIEQQAFEFCNGLTQIKLPAGLTSIGYAAFRDCQNLKSINIPEQVSRIGEAAFSGCSRLSAPKLPDGLEAIDRQAFYNCRSMRILSFPSSLREIGDQAFAYCSVTKIALNENLASIGEKAFFANDLKEIVLPAGIGSVNNGAFHQNGNKSLKAVTVNNPQTVFGRGVFGYDDGWTTYYKAHRKELDAGQEADFDKDNPDNWFDYYADKEDFGQTMLTFTCYPGSPADPADKSFTGPLSQGVPPQGAVFPLFRQVSQDGIHHPVSLFRCQPGPALFRACLFHIPVQCFMEEGARVVALKSEFFPFDRPQPVIDKMTVRAGGKLLQPADRQPVRHKQLPRGLLPQLPRFLPRYHFRKHPPGCLSVLPAVKQPDQGRFDEDLFLRRKTKAARQF